MSELLPGYRCARLSPRVLSLVESGARTIAQLMSGMYDLVLQSCTALVSGSERFSQTGAGWVLRELSHSSPEIVLAFLSDNAHRMSREALRNALRTFPENVRARILSPRNMESGAR
jgi:3-methyladenine DNA glycosylase AlkD